jgi:hypothetical protein
MVLVDVTCKICDETFQFDMGDKSLEELKKILGERDSFQCPGHHFENGSPLDYLIFGKVHEGSAPSENEWLGKMHELHSKIYTSDDLPLTFEVVGFSSGLCVAKIRATGEKVVLDFKASPSGKRYYYMFIKDEE